MKRSWVAACVVVGGVAGWGTAQAAAYASSTGWVYADTIIGEYSTSAAGSVSDSYSQTFWDGGQLASLSVSGEAGGSAGFSGLSISGRDSSSVSQSDWWVATQSFAQAMSGSYDPLHFTGATDGETITVRVGLGTSGQIDIAGSTGPSGWAEAYLSSSFWLVVPDGQGGHFPIGVSDDESGAGSFSDMQYATIQVVAGTPLYLSGDLRAHDNLAVGYTNSAQVTYDAHSWFSFEVLTPGVGYFTDSGTAYAAMLPVPEPGAAWMMLAGAGLLAAGLRRRACRA